MPMFVYLDESGDTGFRFRQGSTKFFVITLLMVKDPIPVQAAVDQLRRDLGLGPLDEFKFSHSSNGIRREFLSELRRHDVRIRALVVDKELMTRPHMRKRDTFYNYLVRLLLMYDWGTISDATLVLDESVKSRKRKLHVGSYIRQTLNSDPENPKIRHIVHHASHTDNLIQAADMACGAIYRRFQKDDDSFLAIIRPRVDDIWVWRPNTP